MKSKRKRVTLCAVALLAVSSTLGTVSVFPKNSGTDEKAQGIEKRNCPAQKAPPKDGSVASEAKTNSLTTAEVPKATGASQERNESTLIESVPQVLSAASVCATAQYSHTTSTHAEG